MNAIKKFESEDAIKAIAKDVGAEVAHYIEIMYPEAVKACSSTFLLSVRNTIYNKLMSVFRSDQDVAVTLSENKKFRQKIKAMWKSNRQAR